MLKKITAVAGKWCQLSIPVMGQRQGRSHCAAVTQPFPSQAVSACFLPSSWNFWEDVDFNCSEISARYKDITTDFKAQEGRTTNNWGEVRWQYSLLSFFSRGQFLPFPFLLFDGAVLWPPPERFQNPPLAFIPAVGNLHYLEIHL